MAVPTPFSEETKMALMQQDIGYVKSKLDEINDSIKLMSSQYVLRSEFSPLKQIVYGLVGIVLVGVVVTILSNLGLKIR